MVRKGRQCEEDIELVEQPLKRPRRIQVQGNRTVLMVLGSPSIKARGNNGYDKTDQKIRRKLNITIDKF
jgi:hypothetical protein